MRHRVAGRKLGRTTAHRKALFRNMAVSLIEEGRIRTTLFKAKELRKVADKLVTLGKSDSLHARRQAFSQLRDREAVTKLFSSIAPAFKARHGGYTRIYRIGERRGDSAPMALIEYLREDFDTAKKKSPAKKTRKASE